MPFLTEVHFQNYRSFLDAKCRLSPVTLVIGANNAGKSNFLGGLEAIVEVMNIKPGPGSGDLSQAHSWKEGMDLADVRVTVRSGSRMFDFHRYPANERGGEWIWHSQGDKICDGVALYNMAESSPLDAEERGAEPIVYCNFSGVEQVLLWLHSTNSKVFAELSREFSEHASGVEELIVKNGVVWVQQSGLDQLMNLAGLSAGSRTVLSLLSIAYQAQRPRLILLENIEHAIHPRGLAPLIETIRRISNEHSVQFVMTTQSPYVLDCFQKKEYWADVVIVEKKDGVSSLANMDERLEKLGYEQEMEIVPLGDLWFSGLMGGVANPPPIWDKQP